MKHSTEAPSMLSDLILKSRLKLSSPKIRNPCYGPYIVRMGAGFRLTVKRRGIKLRIEGCIIHNPTGTQTTIEEDLTTIIIALIVTE
jgi:hypothetical protein